MKVDRLVVDTNVLISALLLPDGLPRKMFDRLHSFEAVLLFSSKTFSELFTRTAREKFRPWFSIEQRDEFLDGLSEVGEWIEPRDEVTLCRDPDDDEFLALALTGRADLIVTGDRDLLELHPFEGIPILTPAELLQQLDAEK